MGLFLTVLLFLSACERYDPKRDYRWEIPFPSESMVPVIQQTIDDDSTVQWWTHPSEIIRAYLNRTPYADDAIGIDIKILSRNVVSATAEMILKDDSLRLVFELSSAYPQKGEKSLMQIVQVKAEKWSNPSR